MLQLWAGSKHFFFKAINDIRFSVERSTRLKGQCWNAFNTYIVSKGPPSSKVLVEYQREQSTLCEIVGLRSTKSHDYEILLSFRRRNREGENREAKGLDIEPLCVRKK